MHADPHGGNVFARSGNYGNKGEHITQIILLDHGLYRNLKEKLRHGYALLWKGILTQDEATIREASKVFGVKNHYIFAAMITSKDWSDIMDKSKADHKERLQVVHDSATKSDVNTKFKLYLKEILQTLQDIDNDFVIVFKINDYLTSIENRLGNPGNSYVHIARYAFKTVNEHLRADHKLTIREKAGLWLQETWLMFKLYLYRFYLALTFKSADSH